jgi:DNA polymerase V
MINKDLSIFCPSENRGVSVPFIDTCVQAGFPSPAEGFLSDPMNVHDLVVKNPAATFFVRVMGDSMQDAGIFSEDILVVDRSLDPREGKIVVAVVDGEFTVKKIHYEAN